MPIYVINIEFGWEIKEIQAKNRSGAIDKADIPVGAVFTIRKKSKMKTKEDKEEEVEPLEVRHTGKEKGTKEIRDLMVSEKLKK